MNELNQLLKILSFYIEIIRRICSWRHKTSLRPSLVPIDQMYNPAGNEAGVTPTCIYPDALDSIEEFPYQWTTYTRGAYSNLNQLSN